MEFDRSRADLNEIARHDHKRRGLAMAAHVARAPIYRRPCIQSHPPRCIWCQLWYHILVEKTTVYLPSDLKAAVKRAAAQRGVSEADVIRESIRAGVGGSRPRPRGGVFTSSEPIARRVDELLDGFGER